MDSLSRQCSAIHLFIVIYSLPHGIIAQAANNEDSNVLLAQTLDPNIISICQCDQSGECTDHRGYLSGNMYRFCINAPNSKDRISKLETLRCSSSHGGKKEEKDLVLEGRQVIGSPLHFVHILPNTNQLVVSGLMHGSDEELTAWNEFKRSFGALFGYGFRVRGHVWIEDHALIPFVANIPLRRFRLIPFLRDSSAVEIVTFFASILFILVGVYFLFTIVQDLRTLLCPQLRRRRRRSTYQRKRGGEGTSLPLVVEDTSNE